MRNVRDADETGPILVHVITQKGKGYEPAERAPDKYHGVSKFNVIAGEQNVGKALALGLVLIVAVVMGLYVLLQRRASRWLH